MKKPEMLRRIYPLVFCLMLLIITSCGDNVDCGERPKVNVDEEQLDREIAEIEAYLEQEGIQYQTDPSGIRYSVLSEGTGSGPNYCAAVRVDYTGSVLGSDELFGSAIDGQFSFRNNSVVPGFKIAIANMNNNADYRVFIPASLLVVRGVNQTQPPNLPVGENVEFRIRLTSY